MEQQESAPGAERRQPSAQQAESQAPAYDSGNIFAKILRGELPAAKVWEDEAALAFMDVMPQAEGHMLLIPKTPCRNLLDAPAQILPHCIALAQKLAQAGQKAFAADGMALMQFNGTAAGQSVFHLHFHIIPRKEGVALRPHGGGFAPAAELEAQAEKIRAALASL